MSSESPEKELLQEVPSQKRGRGRPPKPQTPQLQLAAEKAQRSHKKPFQEKLVYINGGVDPEVVQDLQKQVAQLKMYVEQKHKKTKKKISEITPVKILTLEEQQKTQEPPKQSQSLERPHLPANIKNMSVHEILKLM